MRRDKAIWLVLANLVSTLAKVVTLVVLANIGDMGTAGQYTLALAVVSPIFLLVSLSLRQIYVSAHKDSEYGDFLLLRLVFGLIGIVAVCLGAALLAPSLLPVLAAMGLYKFAEGQVDIRMAAFQRVSDLKTHAVLLMAFNLVASGGLWILFAVSGMLAISITLSSALGLAFCIILARRKLTQRVEHQFVPSIQSIRAAISRGLPLSISSFAVSLGTGVPVFFLGATQSASAVGIYSAIYNISTASNILYTAASQAQLRSFSEFAGAKDYESLLKQGRRASWSLFVAGVAGTVLIYFFGVRAFSFVFGHNFEGFLPALMMMGATICLGPFGFMLDCQLTALHRFKSQGAIAAVALAASVCIAILVVPPLSVLGATLVPFSVMAIRNVAKYVLFRRAMIAGEISDPHE